MRIHLFSADLPFHNTTPVEFLVTDKELRGMANLPLPGYFFITEIKALEAKGMQLFQHQIFVDVVKSVKGKKKPLETSLQDTRGVQDTEPCRRCW